MLFVPKMPALGLLLEFPIFDSYNLKVAKSNNEGGAKIDESSPEYRPPIEFEALKGEMEKFKQEHIYSRMRGIEDRDGMCVDFFLCISLYRLRVGARMLRY